ncbi:pullulanase-type alpha-1,6-glucosidase [Ornithinimicrobium sp. LYQ103]|uniref:pullulanase-type alpha-1,6-glucosidase n=1 Tax=Ornithinimicrobium sp. LYQ103 TaxID=3378796 RepID=UPI00385427F6
MSRPALAGVLSGALLLSAAAATPVTLGVATASTATAAAARTVTLVGNLQDELGCSSDWHPSCEDTVLQPVEGTGSVYSGTFEVPEGDWEYKFALDGGWDGAYPSGEANLPLRIGGPATLEFSFDTETEAVGIVPQDLAGSATDADDDLAQDSLREHVTEEQFYFVMADRFANGDRSNDTAGIEGKRLDHGFDPTDKGFYHGGDLAGIMDRLDYIEGMGTTAIWLTPSFENRAVQGSGDDASAGYHGYWITDFTQIDPHLGTNEEMKALVDEAHSRGMKVYFDIITNHTADVIDYEEGEYGYRSKGDFPYTVSGNDTVFDDKDYAGTDTFPEVDRGSFPYTPVFRDREDETVKVPEWLNDRRLYHNRGDSTFAGESSEYGDFVGLDDLWTERHEVVDGMIDIYAEWAAFGIDGFRIDTVKHVNLEFWQEFSPAVLDAARESNEDFFMFGEVYDNNPDYLSTFTTVGKLQSVIDFGFQSRSIDFAKGAPTTALRDFYAQDDYYTDTNSNAYMLPTFTGNHDMGRAAMMLAEDHSGADLQARVELTNELMFLTRGQPVVYYGDEQGFIGSGGDKDARQDMFATEVDSYATQPLVAAPSGSRDRYDTNHPLYRQIAALSDLREQHLALVDGAQIHRYASAAAGVYAFSRVDADELVEYVVVANNSSSAKRVTVPTWSEKAQFTAVYGDTTKVKTGTDARLSVEVAPLSVEVYRAGKALTPRQEAPAVYLDSPSAGAVVGGRAEIGASVPEHTYAQVTFAYRPVGVDDWTVLGTDDNAPHRVFHDVSGMPYGTLLEYRAVLEDHSGNVSASSSYGIVGEPTSSAGGGGGGGEPVGPVEQPATVSVPGSHNSGMGCGADWAPDCEQAQLSLDAKDTVWKGTYDALPAGSYEYKAAVNKSWTENYGAGGVPGGGNIAYTTDGGPVSFYYDHARHYVTSDAEGPIITAPGSMQSELGCPVDWAPDCMQPWLVDPDGDGTYTWSSTQVPAGNYEFKVAHGLAWGEDYGQDGGNVLFSVPRDGIVTTISYVLETHEISVTTSEAGVAPDLSTSRAYWLTPDLLAWPAHSADQPELTDWRLHWSPDGGLAVDAEAVTGGSSAPLSYDPAGLPASVVEDFPHLEGYLALRLDKKTAKQAGEILKGQVAVAMYDDLGRLSDATGVQIPGVLDALYAQEATQTAYGITWNGKNPTLTLWAPTAQDVDLLLWPKGSEKDPQRVEMKRADDGSWTARGKSSWTGMEYRYEVDVYVPATGKVETNQVTDPWSVALTLNSERSVVVDLRDRRWQPEVWRTSTAPVLEDEVDQSIYELHVRDFSMADPDVPEDLQGSYLAFDEDGYGRRHLEDLAEAGLNTVHLLPTFDIASIEEDESEQSEPACDLESFAPASDQQQACVTAVSGDDVFNWGYDPWHFMAPEGSYASTAKAAHGGQRVAEFRTMVGGLHESGLRVVLDQVFNHTAQAGQGERSVLDKVVPGYFHRLNATGAVETSTCCQNVATEHAMGEKLMVDAVVLWASDYKVDGFRFDLMGHHSRDNMEALRAALDELTLKRDGVDGSQVTLYGEGWNFGEVADNARFDQASQGQLDGTSIATFNDRLRDGVRGGGPFDEDPTEDKGFGSGGTSANDTDLVQIGLAGNLRDFVLRSQETGEEVPGDQISYNGSPAAYAEDPDEVVNYADAHDNETLFDSLTFKLPQDTPMADRVRLNTLSMATVTLSQSISFWHAGSDLLRSKSLDRNSYNSGDWFNLLDFTQEDNGFARGLPPAADNEDKWDVMRPLLADTTLKPAPADIETASAMSQDLLRLRYSTDLFRLGDADLIEQKVSFPVSGTDDGDPQVIVMHIDDTVGADADAGLDGVVVVFNASGEAVDQAVPGLEGELLELSDVQADGADDVVTAATWDKSTATASVPAYTVAVFVQP